MLNWLLLLFSSVCNPSRCYVRVIEGCCGLWPEEFISLQWSQEVSYEPAERSWDKEMTRGSLNTELLFGRKINPSWEKDVHWNKDAVGCISADLSACLKRES